MIARKKLTFEVVTPMYLGGFATRGPDAPADTHIRLRPIKAMWRYWFRALMGSVVGTDRAARQGIQAKERQLFGGIGDDRDGAAAAFRLRLLQDVRPANDSNQYTRDQYGWASYLCYGMGQTQGDNRHRYAIEPDQRFVLELLCKDADWEILATLIRTWAIFGGLGARYRRGAGSLRWVDDPLPVPNLPDFAFLTEARSDFSRVFGNTAIATTPEFDILHPCYCRIRLCPRPFSGWGDALTAIRNQLRIPVEDQLAAKAELERSPATPRPGGPTPYIAKTLSPPGLCLGANGFGWRQRWGCPATFRLAGKWDGARVKFAYFRGREHDLVRRCTPGTTLVNARFGLPIAYSTWYKTIELKLNNKEIRRPSPLAFRVFKVGQHDYRVAVLLFRSEFMPSGAVLKCNSTPVNEPGSYADLEAFIDGCDGSDISFS